MKRSSTIAFCMLALALAQSACFVPGAASSNGGTLATVTPFATGTAGVAPTPSPTHTAPAPTPSPTVTATAESPAGTQHGGEACTYLATFVGDATIPDDSLVAAGSMFVKTWMVRNDGTCTWGPNNHALHALVFAGGTQMGAPSLIPLRDTVHPGQTTGISLTLVAPTTPGTYTSRWMFRVDNDPNGVGPNVGVGPHGDQPLYARIRIGEGLTRLQFQTGTTTAILTGDLAADETRGYVVAAQQGQVIIAGTSLDAWNGGVRVKITTRDNVALPDILPNLDVAASVPETGDYIVWIIGGSYANSYHLAVTIPVRITFAPGASTASLDGSIVNNNEVWYVVRASAGQTLTASLDRSNIALSILGLEDPQVLPGTQSEDIVTSWTGTLPTTQDYIIKVSPVVDRTTYTLTVTIQ